MSPFLAFIAVIVVLALIARLAAPTEQERLMRQRRWDAERAAHAMRRMTKIRQETIRRMDRTERHGR
jgi:hypothetical protein